MSCRQVLAGKVEGRLGVVLPQESCGGSRLHPGLERLIHGGTRLGGVHAGGGHQVLSAAHGGVRLEQQHGGGRTGISRQRSNWRGAAGET